MTAATDIAVPSSLSTSARAVILLVAAGLAFILAWRILATGVTALHESALEQPKALE